MTTDIIINHPCGLPIIIYDSGNVDVKAVLRRVLSGYYRYYGEKPSSELIQSWKFTISPVLRSAEGYPVIIEYPVLGGLDRVDYLVIGAKKILVIEAKYWRCIYERRGYLAKPREPEVRIDPCYQLRNYLAKFTNLHTASTEFEFDGVVFIQGFRYIDSCKVAYSLEDLRDEISNLGGPGGESEVIKIVEGKFHISRMLVDFIKDNKDKLLKDAINTLLGGGYGLTEEQMRVIDDILNAVESGKDKAFFIKGVSGSGKTLMAITLFLEALARGYKALLTYRNNRLLNTLRVVLGGTGLEHLILFFAVGPRGRYRGVAERNFPTDRYGTLDLIIYDEAQRMRRENIETSIERSRVKAYFYDDEQLLVGDEEGFRETFLNVANAKNIDYVDLELSRPARIPLSYLRAVRSLLEGKEFKPEGIDFKVFEDIVEMIRQLRARKEEGHRVALVCAFTETPGNRDDRRAPDNLRIGYPLCKRYNPRTGEVEYSDLDIYKGKGIKIYWLMHEREEYPRYWMGELDPLEYCASVYGAQGFEAEYVGVVWGRDLIWRDGWVVNPEPITDNVGGPYSLKAIAQKDRLRALKLLKNRYLILLTRGTRGVYLFFEDKETGCYVLSRLQSNQMK